MEGGEGGRYEGTGDKIARGPRATVGGVVVAAVHVLSMIGW